MKHATLPAALLAFALLASCDTRSPSSAAGGNTSTGSRSMYGKSRDMAKDVAAGISAGGAAGKQAAADNAQDRLDAADARLDRLKTRREDVPGSKKATYDAALKTAAERIAEARRLITKASDTDLHELSKSNSALAQAIIGSEQALDQAAGCIQE